MLACEKLVEAVKIRPTWLHEHQIGSFSWQFRHLGQVLHTAESVNPSEIVNGPSAGSPDPSAKSPNSAA